MAATGALALAATLMTAPRGADASPAVAAATVPAACPTAVPLPSVTAGMVGTGYSTTQGNTPTTFTATVLGVLPDAIAPGRGVVLVDLGGTTVDEAGGAWFGMSGSPVYLGDRLLGAVAWGFSYGATDVIGLTPGQDLLDLLTLPEGAPAPAAPASIVVPAGLRAAAADAEGVTVAELATTMQPLPVPFNVSGLPSDALSRVADAAARAGVRIVPMAGTADLAAAEPATLSPGTGVGAAESFGDVTSAAIGTTTLVCGDKAVLFGHPFTFNGPSHFAAMSVDTLGLVSDKVFGASVAATLQGLAGTVDQDRMAGLRALLGDIPETLPLTSDVRNLDTGRRRAGHTDVVTIEHLPDVAFYHLVGNFDSIFDRIGTGSSTVTFTVKGTRASGEPWSVTRSNAFALEGDITYASAIEEAAALASIQRNGVEDVTIDSVHTVATVEDALRAYDIDGIEVSVNGEPAPADHVLAGPGSVLRVRVGLRSTVTGERTTKDVYIQVPWDAAGGGDLQVASGGATFDPFQCLYDPQACLMEGETFADLLNRIADAPKNNDLVATLHIYPPGKEDEPPPTPIVTTASTRVDQVVRGSASLPLDTNVPLTARDLSTVCPPDAPSPFADAGSMTDAQRAATTCVAGAGVMHGFDDGTFRAGWVANRGQVASVAARVLERAGVGRPADVPNAFPDDDASGHPADIDWLASLDAVHGFGDGTFRPDVPVTRVQAAAMLDGIIGSALGTFADVQGPYFLDPCTPSLPVDRLAASGIVIGRGDGTFGCGVPIARGELALLAARTMDHLAEEAATAPKG
jgi:hypothetical protein